MNNIWFDALLKKYRFQCSKGVISVEELFDINEQYLEEIYSNLNDKLADLGKESLFNQESSKTDRINNIKNKIEIVSEIAKYRLDEAKKIKKARTIKENRDRINQLIMEKEEESLKEKSIDELKKMRDAL